MSSVLSYCGRKKGCGIKVGSIIPINSLSSLEASLFFHMDPLQATLALPYSRREVMESSGKEHKTDWPKYGLKATDLQFTEV